MEPSPVTLTLASASANVSRRVKPPTTVQKGILFDLITFKHFWFSECSRTSRTTWTLGCLTWVCSLSILSLFRRFNSNFSRPWWSSRPSWWTGSKRTASNILRWILSQGDQFALIANIHMDIFEKMESRPSSPIHDVLCCVQTVRHNSS